MKRIYAIAVAVLLSGIFCLKAGAQDNSAFKDDQWPRVISSNNTVFKVYQPQIDTWDGFTLKCHSAVEAQNNTGQSMPAYGVVDFTVNTLIDKDTRIINFENLRVEEARFPSEPDQGKSYLNSLRTAAPMNIKSISLDRLEANLNITSDRKQYKKYGVLNNPPKIIFSKMPAILVNIDGEPVFFPVEGTGLSRIVNTRVLLLKGNGRFYLHVLDGYMESTDLNGGWVISYNPPASVKKAQDSLTGSQALELMEGEEDPDTKAKPSLSYANQPVVYVVTAPAELIITDGEQNYVPINGTNLLYVSNTPANIFKDMGSQMTYVLISGRWFRSRLNTGPWEYVQAEDLPGDFANIPDDSPKENVKASIPGTSQAREALVANDLPTVAKIDRMKTKIELTIDGTPSLSPIEGTPLYYVFNCSIPVIKVDERTWFAVYNGVWFSAANINGPWVTADFVPEIIYTIPVGSPLHYVTYVRIYRSVPGYVYAGYTPGYYGTVVNADGIVVYGTGYFYRPYIGRHFWYSPVVTYGFSTSLCWTPWYGWSYSFGIGWGYPVFRYHPPVPYWGPFYHAWKRPVVIRSYYSTSRNIYYRFEGRHDWNREPEHHGWAYNSRTGAIIIGHRNAVKNVYPAHNLTRIKELTRVKKIVTVNPGYLKNTGRSDNHLYGTREGHVYSYDRDNKGGYWRHVAGPGKVAITQPNRDNERRLDHERSARDIGENRTGSFRTYGHNDLEKTKNGKGNSKDKSGKQESGNRGQKSKRSR